MRRIYGLAYVVAAERIRYRWRGEHDVQMMLAAQTFCNNLHMQRAEKSAPKSPSESAGLFFLKIERAVGTPQGFQAAEKLIKRVLRRRIHACPNHRRGLAIPFKRRRGRGRVCKRISNTHHARLLYLGCHEIGRASCRERVQIS